MRGITTVILLLSSAGFLLSCNQTKTNHKEARTDDNKVQTADDITNQKVTLSAVPKTLKLSELPDSIKVIMTNNTNDTISTGLHYYIEKFEGNEWKEISPKDIVFHDLGWQLKPSDTEGFEKKLYKGQINYKTGKYRIVKYYLKSDYQQTKQN